MGSKQFSWFNYFLMTGIITIPFITYHKIADPNLLSRQIAISGLCLGAVLFLHLNRNEIKWIPFSYPLFIAIGIWFGSYLIGFFNVFSISESLYFTSKIALYCAIIYLFTHLFLNQKINTVGLNRAVTGMVWIAIVFLGFEIWTQYQAGIHLLKGKNLYQLSTVFSHKNLFSSALLLCFPFLVQTVLKDNKTVRLLAGITLMLMIPILLFIQTKAVIAGIFLGTLVCFIPFSRLMKPRFPKIYQGGIMAFSLSILVFAGFSFLHPEKFVLLYNNETFRERLLLWQNTWQMIKEFPYSGVGGGNWQIYFPKYGLHDFMQTNYQVSDGYTTFQRPHNDFLWVWSESGPIGLASYLAMFGIVLYNCYKLFKNSLGLKESLTWLSLFFTLIAYLFIAFFDFPLERNEHQFLLGLIIAQVLGSTRTQKTETTVKESSGNLIMITIILSTSLFIAISRIPGERSSLKIIQAHASNNWEMILRETPKCINTFYTIDNFSIPIYWYSGVAHYALNDLPAAKSDFEKAYHINPYQVHVLNNIAGLYEKEGNHEQALQYYDELLKISPTQPDAILNKSAVLFNMNRIKAAFECIYQFKFDEENTQFTGFLKVIGKAYLEQLSNSEKDSDKKIKWLLMAQDEKSIQHFFIFNKEQKRPVNQLSIP